MPANPEPVQSLFVRDDDEGLFSRDINGQLVRLDAPTESDYEKTVTVQIDGQPVTVPLAEPLKDANGNTVLDIEDRTTPRYTTIYDAAVKLYVKQPGDEAKIPIPTLCHLPHMTPVAVCRLCVVQIYGTKRLTEFVIENPSKIDTLVKGVVEDVEKFVEGKAQSDDICLVGFQRVS